MEREPIDFDRGNLTTGATIHIFNNFDNSWKSAVVQEIDSAEREILVDYDDGTQEWIGVDNRKICYPPVKTPKTSETSDSASRKRRASSTKTEKHQPSAKKSKPNSSKDSKKSVASSTSSKKSNSHISAKSTKQSNFEKKTMSKSSSGSGFLRLKFKSNNNKNGKSNTKADSSKKRKREEQHTQEEKEDLKEVEPAPLIEHSKKSTSKSTSSRTKESKRESTKLKIRINKHEAKVISSTENSASPADKAESPSFSSVNEKKIKTLLPKRSAPELLNKVSSPSISIPEIQSPISTSLSSIYPTANVTSTLNLTRSSSSYICPKQDCKKQFRNENLLMMHIKHYHREYRNMLQSMPNVADLAYARTVGEHIESPQASFLERIARLEEDKLNKTDDSNVETELAKPGIDEKTTPSTTNTEKTAEPSKVTSKSTSKKTPLSKRVSGSEASPKLPTLLAQLQGPPLVPPPISIQSDNVDAELSVSQNKPSSVSSPQLSERSNSFAEVDEKPDSGTKKRRLSQLDSTDVINCSCGYGLEDGLMIQCDLCQCWQHGSCVGFENETDVPSNYTCETCQFPKRCHSSRKYLYVQNWLKEGIVPRFQFNACDEEQKKKREEYLKQTHSFLCDLTELRHAVQSLQVKIQILRQTPDHPKLYLWAKSWDSKTSEKEEEEEKNKTALGAGPVPEAAINMTDCRKHLSEHIKMEIEKADKMLRSIEEKIDKLEEPDDGEADEEDNFDKEPEKYTSIAKQTLLMMLRDLTALQTFKYCER